MTSGGGDWLPFSILPRQHFLNFSPLPHGHGSFRPSLVACALIDDIFGCWSAQNTIVAKIKRTCYADRCGRRSQARAPHRREHPRCTKARALGRTPIPCTGVRHRRCDHDCRADSGKNRQQVGVSSRSDEALTLLSSDMGNRKSFGEEETIRNLRTLPYNERVAPEPSLRACHLFAESRRKRRSSTNDSATHHANPTANLASSFVWRLRTTL